MLTIESLDKRHDRSGFESGYPELDDWLKTKATQWSKKNLSRVYVATRVRSIRVLGYYSLSNHYLEYEALPESVSKGLPRRTHLPTILLGKLAVCRSAQGRGLGRHLLFDALGRCLRIAEEVAVAALEVEATDEKARQFYEHMGLETLLDDQDHLFIPIRSIGKLGL